MHVSAFLLIFGAFCRVPTSLLQRGDVVLCTDIILRFGCNCKLPAGAFQWFSTVPYHTVCTHLVSVHGQTPQPVTRVAGKNGLMSLAPMNGASVGLAKEKPYGQKNYLSQVNDMYMCG